MASNTPGTESDPWRENAGIGNIFAAADEALPVLARKTLVNRADHQFDILRAASAVGGVVAWFRLVLEADVRRLWVRALAR